MTLKSARQVLADCVFVQWQLVLSDLAKDWIRRVGPARHAVKVAAELVVQGCNLAGCAKTNTGYMIGTAGWGKLS